jgi:hypothetical protein
MDNKKLAKFYADTLRNRELSDEQSMTLQQMLFPGIGDDEAARLRDGALDMANALMKWEAKQAKQADKDGHHVTPMSDAEADALAAIM